MYRHCLPGIALLAGAVLLLGPSRAAGQSAVAGLDPERATLVGAVIDSINGGPLAGATVMIDGTPLLAIADDEGLFRIDSIPPGSYRLAVFHPMLDSLGMTIGTQAMRFGADSIREVVLATPSAETLIDEWCSPATRRSGPGALVGRALDPETAAPMAGARVTIVWEETEVDESTASIRRVPRVRAATADATGRFALCGMKADMRGTLQAEHGPDKTPELPVAMDGRRFAIRTVLIGRAVVISDASAGAGADSSTAVVARPTARIAGSATVTGRVRDAADHPVAGVQVSVEGTGIEAETDSAGTFTITRVPAGSWVVAARRIGYRPSELTVHLRPRRTERVTLLLAETGAQLAPVVVTGDAAAGLERVGFADRKRSGMGRYLTSEQIAERRPMRTTELFETMPGITVVPNGRGGYSLRSSRDAAGGCVTVFVDGMHWMETGAGDLDMSLLPEQIAAVEVYSQSTRPGEFTTPGQTQCAAVVFWTKTRVGQRQ